MKSDKQQLDKKVDELKALVTNYPSDKVNVMLKNLIKKLKNKSKRQKVDFDVENCQAFHELKRIFVDIPNVDDLLFIANAVSKENDIIIHRDQKRSKALLVQWFDENWNVIKPCLEKSIMFDTNGNRIYPVDNNDE